MRLVPLLWRRATDLAQHAVHETSGAFVAPERVAAARTLLVHGSMRRGAHREQLVGTEPQYVERDGIDLR